MHCCICLYQSFKKSHALLYMQVFINYEHKEMYKLHFEKMSYTYKGQYLEYISI